MRLFILRLSLIILLCSFHSLVNAQVTINSDSLSVSGKIVDKSSGKLLPYATIYNKSNGSGTVSDLEGTFRLEGIHFHDTLVFSFIGYDKFVIIVSRSLTNEEVFLKPKVELLSEITVFGDNSFLYNLLSSCRKDRYTRSQTAKTYFLLKSFVNHKQVELLECYYNGDFSNYNVDQLHIKEGRIALARFGKRFFVSTETSKSLYSHKLFDENDYFPASPFELGKRKLKKEYRLSLKSKYHDDNLHPIYVIEFTPKDSTLFFKGQVWIDSLHNQVIKVSLQANNAVVYPFMPLGNMDSIKKVNLYLSKTYHSKGGEMFVSSINFNYQITYKTFDDSTFTLNTNAVLNAYNYDDQFLLPRFHFSPGRYEDYRKINGAPYNQFFWDNIQEFGIKDIKKRNDAFMKNNATITSKTLFLGNSFFDKGLFEEPYVFWSKKRVTFRKQTRDVNDNNSYIGALPSERYHLKAQIYLDINYLNDSLNFLTRTVFDPFESYYHYQITDEGKAFINMYFDIVEIYRRELDAELQKEKDAKTMMLTYNEKMKQLENTTNDFFRDVQHGTNRPGMIQWNEYIKKRLNIDNVAIFNLYKDDQEE